MQDLTSEYRHPASDHGAQSLFRKLPLKQAHYLLYSLQSSSFSREPHNTADGTSQCYQRGTPMFSLFSLGYIILVNCINQSRPGFPSPPSEVTDDGSMGGSVQPLWGPSQSQCFQDSTAGPHLGFPFQRLLKCCYQESGAHLPSVPPIEEDCRSPLNYSGLQFASS